MKTVIMIMGRSGSGKSTLERNLVSDYPHLFHKVVSVTTRPIRENEVDGVDYRFISDEDFQDYVAYEELVQSTEFAGNRYGSLYSDYTTPHPYATLVVVPDSAATFIPVLEEKLPSADILLVYFDISDDRIRANMLTRGDHPEDIEARLAKDNLDEQFRNSGLDADYIIGDNMLNDTTSEDFMAWLLKRKI